MHFFTCGKFPDGCKNYNAGTCTSQLENISSHYQSRHWRTYMGNQVQFGGLRLATSRFCSTIAHALGGYPFAGGVCQAPRGTRPDVLRMIVWFSTSGHRHLWFCTSGIRWWFYMGDVSVSTGQLLWCTILTQCFFNETPGLKMFHECQVSRFYKVVEFVFKRQSWIHNLQRWITWLWFLWVLNFDFKESK